jgi:hypothetical protein
MGRMSALHDAMQLTGGQSIPPVSRNGGGGANTANGTGIDMRGLRGAYFTVQAGALTGAANYAAYLQGSTDAPNDLPNATWSNINATTYTNAAVTVKTNANSAFEMSYDPTVGGTTSVRAVLVTDANVAVVGIAHLTF